MPLKYSCQVTINKPRQEVVNLMSDPKNMKHWQPGFISLEPVKGTPGEQGAVSVLRYKMGKREMEMTETILKMDLPNEINAIYETKKVYNEQVNRFYEVDANTTRWVSDSVFKFSGPMKLAGWLMPGAFKKQSKKYLELFKAYAEEKN